MSILAIPNVSEGRDSRLIGALRSAITEAGAEVLDVHSDPIHNRTVLTVVADKVDDLPRAMAALAAEAKVIDLTSHRGEHPRLGGLDVCPFVPHNNHMDAAVMAADQTAILVGEEVGLPVYLYGEAALRQNAKELPDLRLGGLPGLMARARGGFVPDIGPREIDPRRGVVCVGARGPLIAFNVWLHAELEVVRSIAQEVRRPGLVRALGMPIRPGISQVSMNLIRPQEVGIDTAYELVERKAAVRGVSVIGTELVGLVAERWLPDPQKQAARRLFSPGRSIESALSGRKTAI
jgi:glutamate formiminotransferase